MIRKQQSCANLPSFCKYSSFNLALCTSYSFSTADSFFCKSLNEMNYTLIEICLVNFVRSKGEANESTNLPITFAPSCAGSVFIFKEILYSMNQRTRTPAFIIDFIQIVNFICNKVFVPKAFAVVTIYG